MAVFLRSMAKEILLYEDAYSWTSSRAVSELNDARLSPEVKLRFNGDGGELRYGWAVIGKAKEIKGKKVFTNDGEANSMYAFAFCYNDNNEAFDTSCFNFHRASYGLDYEQSGYCTESEFESLKDKNDKLRAAMEAKLDVPSFTEITGLTMDQLFSMEGRAECRLTADQAFQCKLINRVVPITPEYSEQIRVLTAHFTSHKIAAKTETKPNNMADNITSKEALKAAYPELYKQIFASGVKRGTEKEYERVAPMFAYYSTNPVKIKAAFESLKPMDEVTKMECMQKSISAQSVAAIEAENAPPIILAEQKQVPASAGDPAKKSAEAAFQKSMDEQFATMYPNSKKAK